MEWLNGLLNVIHGTINANKEPLFFKSVYRHATTIMMLCEMFSLWLYGVPVAQW